MSVVVCYESIQHNGIQHYDIQHNDIQHIGIQHNGIQHMTLSITVLVTVKLSADMRNVVMLSVVTPMF
jgi:hypothetical protein